MLTSKIVYEESILSGGTKIGLAEARQWCRRLAKRHYENFIVASWFLPSRRREEYFALYGFARGADDLADESAGSVAEEESGVSGTAALDEWSEMLDALYRGEEPGHPAFVALEPVIQARQHEKELFSGLLDAFRRDQVQKRYETWHDLRTYTACSADPVGRMVLRLYGYRDPLLDRLSDAICTGLQLVNFLQDIRDDYITRGRIYLPEEDIRRFGVTEEMLVSVPTPVPLRRLVAFETVRAERLFLEGRPLINMVRPGLSRQLILFHGGGRLALGAIRRAGYDVNSRHRKVRHIQLIALLLRAFQSRPL